MSPYEDDDDDDADDDDDGDNGDTDDSHRPSSLQRPWEVRAKAADKGLGK